MEREDTCTMNAAWVKVLVAWSREDDSVRVDNGGSVTVDAVVSSRC